MEVANFKYRSESQVIVDSTPTIDIMRKSETSKDKKGRHGPAKIVRRCCNERED